jgi:hypothetical protein
MVRCSKCSHVFDPLDGAERIVSITGCVGGEERVETFYYCGRCGLYTVEECLALFSGHEKINIHGPMGKAEGDAKVELIRACPGPWDRECRCPTHLAYFEDGVGLRPA